MSLATLTERLGGNVTTVPGQEDASIEVHNVTTEQVVWRQGNSGCSKGYWVSGT